MEGTKRAALGNRHLPQRTFLLDVWSECVAVLWGRALDSPAAGRYTRSGAAPRSATSRTAKPLVGCPPPRGTRGPSLNRSEPGTMGPMGAGWHSPPNSQLPSPARQDQGCCSHRAQAPHYPPCPLPPGRDVPETTAGAQRQPMAPPPTPPCSFTFSFFSGQHEVYRNTQQEGALDTLLRFCINILRGGNPITTEEAG